MPGHVHTATSSTESTVHAHLFSTYADVYQHSPGAGGGQAALGALNSTSFPNFGLTGNEDALHIHAVTIGTTGGGSIHNNMQPYLVANWIMRAV
jgi:microcystin-dependent protein